MDCAPRVVSLLSSATEWVYALGGEHLLVGRSHECDYPPEAMALPACSQPLIDVNATSAEIDRQVKTRQRDALSIYDVDREMLRTLRPDIILTQTQCEVCAVSLADVERALCTLTDHAARVVSLSPENLEDIWESGRDVARALGLEAAGEQFLTRCQTRLDELAARVTNVRARRNAAPVRVLCLEWMDPPMAAGNWMPELIRLAGGEPLFGEIGKHSPWLTWDEIVAADPEVVVLLPCGWGLDRIQAELTCVIARPEWTGLTAVRTGRVALADGNQFFNRPGPRLVESAEILAEIFWSDEPSLSFHHKGSHWRPLAG